MTLTLLVLTDGRGEYLEQTLAAFRLMVDQRLVTRSVIVNDCPDIGYARWVETLGFDRHVWPENSKRGFGGAIQAGWDAIGETDFVFHLEDDFILNRYVDAASIMKLLDQCPHLAQMALRRQPWNDEEIEAGGYVALKPLEYADHKATLSGTTHSWLEHRVFFTTNPSIYRGSLMADGWPDGANSEGHFSLKIFQNPQVACGLWGQRDDPPWVHHIGKQRVGTGY